MDTQDTILNRPLKKIGTVLRERTRHLVPTDLPEVLRNLLAQLAEAEKVREHEATNR